MYRDDLPPAPLVITTFNKQVIALSVADGTPVWKVQMPAAQARVFVDGPVAYVARNDGVIVALDYMNGSTRWTAETGMSSLRVTLLVTRDLIFVSFSGETACIAKNGSLLWKNSLPGTGYGAAGLAVPGAAAHGDFGDNSG